MQDDWFNGVTLAAAGKIVTRWDAVIKNDTAWGVAVATPSSANYKPSLAAGYISKRNRPRAIIVGLQEKKLAESFTKASTNFHDMFANSAEKYNARVLAKAGNFSSKVLRTLAATGSRLAAHRGAASFICRCIASDNTVQRDYGGGNTFSGVFDPTILDTPEVGYVKPEMRSIVRAALSGAIVQVVQFVLLNLYDDLTVPAQFLADIIHGLQDTGQTATVTVGGGGTAFSIQVDLDNGA